MTVNSKMTALAEEIRELSGTTDTKSLDEMISDVDAANTEIAEQADLLGQIATALEGKAGGSNVSTKTWTGRISLANDLSGGSAIYYTDENSTIRTLLVGTTAAAIDENIITIAAGTVIFFSNYRYLNLTAAEEITEQIDKDNYWCNVIRPTANDFIIED